ncbi:MAG: response regulator transcription factor [Myxococcota bacterium]
MKLLICDDHAVFRAGLRTIAVELAADVELLEAEDGEAAIALADAHPDLDLALLDLRMPGVNGHAGVRRFRKAHPSLPVVVVSADEDAETVRASLDAGAAGHIPKSSTGDQMLAALRLVLAGGTFVPRSALLASTDASRRRSRADGLTVRQREVLSLVARGLTNKEICGVLGLAEGTVKSHLAAIFEALEVTNRTEAAVAARELDLRAPGED